MNVNAVAGQEAVGLLLPPPGPQLHRVESECLGLGVESLPAEGVNDSPPVQTDQASTQSGLSVQEPEYLV